VVKDEIDRVKVTGVDTVADEDVGCEGALQGGEPENGISIAAEDELDEAVAESADTVVEEDRRHGFVSKTVAGTKGKNLCPGGHGVHGGNLRGQLLRA